METNITKSGKILDKTNGTKTSGTVRMLEVSETMDNESKSELQLKSKSLSESESETIIHCKYCNSSHTIKKGIKYNKQEYHCKDCKRYFRIGDNRIKRDIKQKELALLLYSSNVSIRSIQNVINKFFDTNISFAVVDNWLKTSANLLSYDIKRQEKERARTIEVLELDELYSKYYDIKKKKNEQKGSKYGLLLTESEVKLLHIK